jgi:hypothetical protein
LAGTYSQGKLADVQFSFPLFSAWLLKIYLGLIEYEPEQPEDDPEPEGEEVDEDKSPVAT